MRHIFFILICFFITSCGYKPISKISTDLLGENVFVDVIISKVDPKNSVYIKDSVREGVVNRLHKNLAENEENADSKIYVSIKSINFSPLMYDQYGYVTTYKANLTLNYKTYFKDGSVSNITTSGEYDFKISGKIKNTRFTDSIISDTERYNAIKNSSSESFDEYISKLAIRAYNNVN
ncbi:LPS assembly lipoprotein LptE [Campylobacter sputorum]|uniref:LPS assembly lipoprotein LptE n=1 Tax=Campylobacter sputorum TaxID=206 RepID=UPI000B790AA5|nr:LPS assembly lipoprotein LptE [Campylobacter sputorum]ASM36631.1 putative lipooligosaccharide transport system, OM component (LptE family) [Campylobacter sputorum bv. faecalis CCUG 20703]